ncbi:hypothetical protein FACS18945_4700 [Bacteroidia bacterium]|nr:hypothetical protein FACS189434_03530 [Bacteroidia bacterium]GHT58656.1 hypothetical protein FACS18945_4700 [Bacteroidia bacterium]
MKYQIYYSEQAEKDIDELFYLITEIYQAPLTAANYVQGIYNEIKTLEYAAETYKLETDDFYRQFGFNVRRINYKNTAIIYTVNTNYLYETFVCIRRIMSAKSVI